MVRSPGHGVSCEPVLGQPRSACIRLICVYLRFPLAFLLCRGRHRHGSGARTQGRRAVPRGGPDRLAGVPRAAETVPAGHRTGVVTVFASSDVWGKASGKAATHRTRIAYLLPRALIRSVRSAETARRKLRPGRQRDALAVPCRNTRSAGTAGLAAAERR
jgi:hypothetical protein